MVRGIPGDAAEHSYGMLPVGTNVYFTIGVIKDVLLMTIFKSVASFRFAMIVSTILLIAFSQIATWLPNFM